MPVGAIVSFVVVFALTLLAVSLGLKFFDTRRKTQMTEMLHTAAGEPVEAIHNLLKEINSEIPSGFKALLASLHFTRHAQEQIQQAGLNWTSTRLLTSMAIAGILGLVLGTLFPLLVNAPITAVVVGLAFSSAPYFYVRKKRQKRLNLLEEQFPESLDFLSRSMRAGHAFSISLQMVGVNLTSLSFLAGAVGVGFGFGLQNIISNFISGLIILAERPIKIGDRVEIGGVAGQVREISLRSTTVVTNDNMAIIVPNANFITQQVTNWSYEDPRVRFRIPFGVAHGTDLPTLRKLMMEVAAGHPKVLKEPKPELFCIGITEDGLNFELAVWSSEATTSPRQFRSDLFFAIDQKLRENAIKLPAPPQPRP